MAANSCRIEAVSPSTLRTRMSPVPGSCPLNFATRSMWDTMIHFDIALGVGPHFKKATSWKNLPQCYEGEPSVRRAQSHSFSVPNMRDLLYIGSGCPIPAGRLSRAAHRPVLAKRADRARRSFKVSQSLHVCRVATTASRVTALLYGGLSGEASDSRAQSGPPLRTRPYNRDVLNVHHPGGSKRLFWLLQLSGWSLYATITMLSYFSYLDGRSAVAHQSAIIATAVIGSFPLYKFCSFLWKVEMNPLRSCVLRICRLMHYCLLRIAPSIMVRLPLVARAINSCDLRSICFQLE